MEEKLVKLEGISDELLELVHKSVEMGLASIEGDEDLIPVLNIKSTMIVLQTETLDEARGAVQHVLVSSAVACGVLMYNGYALDEQGMRTRALLAEAYERDKSLCVRFAQQYRPSIRAGFMQRSQPLTLIGGLRCATLTADEDSHFVSDCL